MGKLNGEFLDGSRNDGSRNGNSDSFRDIDVVVAGNVGRPVKRPIDFCYFEVFFFFFFFIYVVPGSRIILLISMVYFKDWLIFVNDISDSLSYGL